MLKQLVCRPSHCPGRHWESLQRSPDHVASSWMGPREGKEKERRGEETRRKGGKGKGMAPSLRTVPTPLASNQKLFRVECSQSPLKVLCRVVPEVADLVAFTGIAAVVGIVVVVSFVANIFVTVAFGVVVVLMEVVVVTVGVDIDVVVLDIVALVVTLDEVVEGVVVPVVRESVGDAAVLGLVVVVAVTVVFSSGALALDSSAAAVVFSVCTVAA